MGLDAVELVMAVEEKFGISITDEEATRTLTVGDLKRLVRTKLDMTDAVGCLTQRAFHVIRRNAIATFGIGQRGLQPNTQLDSIVPHDARRESWQQFQTALGVTDLPELVRPNRVRVTITVLVLSSLVVPVWYGALHPSSFGRWAALGAVVAVAVGWIAERLTRPMKTTFQHGYCKVRDLARFLVARHPDLIGKPRTGKWTEEEISCLLREVIMEQLAVSEFDDKSRFVQDLHIG